MNPPTQALKHTAFSGLVGVIMAAVVAGTQYVSVGQIDWRTLLAVAAIGFIAGLCHVYLAMQPGNSMPTDALDQYIEAIGEQVGAALDKRLADLTHATIAKTATVQIPAVMVPAPVQPQQPAQPAPAYYPPTAISQVLATNPGPQGAVAPQPGWPQPALVLPSAQSGQPGASTSMLQSWPQQQQSGRTGG